jgi:hypothetical protein
VLKGQKPMDSDKRCPCCDSQGTVSQIHSKRGDCLLAEEQTDEIPTFCSKELIALCAAMNAHIRHWEQKLEESKRHDYSGCLTTKQIQSHLTRLDKVRDKVEKLRAM